MPDIQTTESVEAAKKRLKELQEQKDGKSPSKAGTDGDKRSIEEIIHAPMKKPKKKGFGTKLKEAFFGEGIGNGSIADHIFFGIFIPKLKLILSDMANSAINSALGLDNKTRLLSGGGANTHQSNASLYGQRAASRSNLFKGTTRNAFREETWDGETANDIYSQMVEILENYPALSLAHVYSMMGFGELIRQTDYDWGWTSPDGLEPVCIDRANDLWVFDLPPTKRI